MRAHATVYRLNDQSCSTTSGVARNFREGVRQSAAFFSQSLSIPINGDVHIVCRIRLDSIVARLSLIDKNIGTSARFYA